MSTYNDLQQVKNLNEYSRIVHESQFETLFQAITELASKQCRAPVALVTFVDSDQIHIHSETGFSNKNPIPNKRRFCGIFPDGKEFYEICDTDQDEIHQNHLMYLDKVKARYYAGARINLPLGEMIGVLCIFDVKPRRLSKSKKDLLISLANIIEKALVAKGFTKPSNKNRLAH